MTKKYTAFILGGLVLASICFFLWRSSRLQIVSDMSEQMVALSPAHISYRSVRLPLSGNGLLFYKAQLNRLPFAHMIDKVNVKVDGNEVHISFIGFSFNVKEALRGIYGDNLVDDLKSYVPYQSIFTRPLQSLALAGIENVKLNAKFTLKNTGISRQITGELQDKKIGRATFNIMFPANNALVSVDSLMIAPMVRGEFSFEDVAFEEAYRAYAKSLGEVPPTQGLNHVRIIMPVKEVLQEESVN